MDNNRNYDAVSYMEVLTGPPHCNSISWLTKLYLKKKYGLDRRGAALDSVLYVSHSSEIPLVVHIFQQLR